MDLPRNKRNRSIASAGRHNSAAAGDSVSMFLIAAMRISRKNKMKKYRMNLTEYLRNPTMVDSPSATVKTIN